MLLLCPIAAPLPTPAPAIASNTGWAGSTSPRRQWRTYEPRTRRLHGYDEQAALRLEEQAAALESLLHHDTRYAAGRIVLEAGCGVGAQTMPLARNSPGAQFLSIDISADSLALAASRARAAGVRNVSFRQADVTNLPFAPESFDDLFICFLLEHLPRPQQALRALLRLVKPGGTVTVIEGDHGSAFFHPPSEAAVAAIKAQVTLQRMLGGNAEIGRQLHPMLASAGCVEVSVSPRLVYVDGSSPDLAEQFTRRTFAAMIEAVRARALKERLIESSTFDAGVDALHRTSEPDGVFCYTFFKGTALRPGGGA